MNRIIGLGLNLFFLCIDNWGLRLDSCWLLACLQETWSPAASPSMPAAAWWPWWMYPVSEFSAFIWHSWVPLDIYDFLEKLFQFSALMLHFKKTSITGKLNSEEFVRLWNKVNSYKVMGCKCKPTSTRISATHSSNNASTDLSFSSLSRTFSSALMCLGLGRCHWVNSGMRLKCQVEWLQQL